MRREIRINGLLTVYHRLMHLIRRSTPLRTSHDEVSPFFIIGSGRCGTTLLREMINQHSGIIIPPESYALPTILKKHHIYNGVPWKDYVNIITGEFESHKEFYTWNLDMHICRQHLLQLNNGKRSLQTIIDTIYREYCKSINKSDALWGDKSVVNTLYLDHIDRLFQAPKYIHVVRDGRDVAASFLESRLQDSLVAASNHWNNVVDYTRNYKHSDRMLEIRYESLVSQPEKEIKRLCTFLAIKYEPKMIDLENGTFKTRDLIYQHHHNVKNAINTGSIGKWKTYFSDEEKKKVGKLLEKNLIALGYEPGV